MAIIVGIDEAGYGPVLGPLVVGGVAFRVSDDAVGDCLWRRLEGSITRKIGGARERRLPVADSKKLYHRKAGLGLLERTALVMASASGDTSVSLRGLLDGAAAHVVSEMAAHPWYRDFDQPLPVENDPRDIALRANAVKRDMSRADVRFLGLFAEPLLERAYNRLVDKTRNKAVVSLGLVLRIVDRVARFAGDEHIRVLVDHQGGRQHYGQSLMSAFAEHELRIVSETPDRSAYRMLHRAWPLDIEFVVGGEDEHMPIALASVFAKYLRELFMLAFNRYWSSRVDGLRPTAGYYEDAQRFLADIDATVRRDGIGREMLVRNR